MQVLHLGHSPFWLVIEDFGGVLLAMLANLPYAWAGLEYLAGLMVLILTGEPLPVTA